MFEEMNKKDVIIIGLCSLLCIILLIVCCILSDISDQIKDIKTATVEAVGSHPATIETQQADKLQYLGEFTLTAYCSCEKCCGKSNGITASGTKATAGRTIAVDPVVIPYGTRVIIRGHEYIAEDCGGAVKGNKIDIYFNTHAEAEAFGKQHAEVYIK